MLGALLGAGSGDNPGSAPETADPLAAADAIVPGLDDRALAGERLIAGWDGPTPPRGLERMIRRGALAGVILFADNIGGPGETRRLIGRLQRIERPPGLREPLLVMVDQEGGQVRRLPGPPDVSAEAMGAAGSAYARSQGRKTALELRSYGFNLDLAPVLDIARPGGAIDREDRSFGTTPATVAAGGVDGFAEGLRDGGIAATAKHFPGIGMVATNTDFSAQKVGISQQQLRERDELPFEAFSRAEGEVVMLGLATYTAFADRPAAFSRKLVTGELRRRLGFEGVTITDGLGAAAAQSFGSDSEIALAAAGAGADLLLYSDWREARGAAVVLGHALREERIDREEFARSAARVLALRSRIGSRR